MLSFLAWNPELCGQTWGWDCLLPSCPSWFLSATSESGTACSASCCHGCLLLPLPSSASLHHTASSLLPLHIWMNISSLNPWLSNFHTVWYSGSSSWFLVLDWLLSFLWLCKEAKWIYLCFHLGWKSILKIINGGHSFSCIFHKRNKH